MSEENAPSECPMIELEIDVGRRTGTTFQDVAKGLLLAGCMKDMQVVNPYDASPDELAKLKEHLAGELIWLDIEEASEKPLRLANARHLLMRCKTLLGAASFQDEGHERARKDLLFDIEAMQKRV